MLIDKNLTSTGERLRRARILAGISTRRAFEEKYHISANTLQGWEQGKNPLSKKGAKRIIEALKREGLMCSLEWLMHGQGVPPRAFEKAEVVNEADLENLLSQMHLQEEQAIYQELQTFKTHNPHAIIITVSDDGMTPFFKPGDYVGGIRFTKSDDIQHYLGEPCIIELEDHTILIRHLYATPYEDTYTLSCTNLNAKQTPLVIPNAKIISAAPILWHRRRLKV
ncbi:MAG: hypothetical protein A3E84_05465 [Gammaproteobacteria bacterium RIFCSPHIGHO2_12_FULL_42_13]|nr:MAG: hypothetical protein A3E84_05465 [Gammaproteobacteria bacterium RIFCSPHIGHO2_12_FULL_42_13]